MGIFNIFIWKKMMNINDIPILKFLYSNLRLKWNIKIYIYIINEFI